MAQHKVGATFTADASGYIRSMRDAERATQGLGRAADEAGQKAAQTTQSTGKAAGGFSRMSQAVRDNSADLQTAGATLVGVGAGLSAMTVGVGKAAMDWESAWAGVQKTNDGTSEQMQALEGDLRELATTLPATHGEIAAVAEAAGQLGVGVDDVSEFTETMINLGETTNLSAEEAATGLARFSNIMGTSFDDADKLGSTIVGLGNNFATTESEILNMSMRVAAIGDQMGMTEAEVMGLSTAMSSVGIRAEAGGTAISNTMKKIDGAVRGGGEALTGWAEAAGVSAEEFATAWQERPAEAMVMLTEGLGEADAAGKDVNGMLEDLGITGIRESDTLLRLAGASDLLADSFAMGSEEFDKNSALAEEAAIRYETTEAKISVAWNTIKDAAIDAGGAILPVIGGLAEGVADMAGWFSDLPDPVIGAITALSGVAGVASLAAGGLLLVAPRAVETVDAFRRLAPAGSKLNGVMGKVGKSAGVAAAAFVGFSILKEVANNAVPAAEGVESMANALSLLNDAGDMTAIDEIFNKGTQELTSFVDAIELMDPSTLNAHMESFGETVFGLRTETAQAREQLDVLDQTLSVMDSEQASDQLRTLKEELEAAGNFDLSTWTGLKEMFPELAAEIEGSANAMYGHVEDADLFQIAMGNVPGHLEATGDAADGSADGLGTAGDAMGEMGDSAEDAAEKLDEVLGALTDLGLITRDARSASREYQQALDDMTASIEENGETFDENTDKGRANAEALDNIAQKNLDNAAAAAESGATQQEVAGILKDGADAYYENALAIGHTEGEAERLTRAMYEIPPGVDIDTYMEDEAFTVAQATGQVIDEIPDGLSVIATMSTSAREEAWATADAIDLIPNHERVDVAVSENGTAGQVQASVNDITGKTEYVFVDDNGTSTSVQQQIVNIDGVDRTVWVDDAGTIYATKSEIQAMPDGDSTIWADAETGAAESALNRAARNRTSLITQNVTRTVSTFRGMDMPGREHGGVVPRLASGGRLPYTGLGTDQIMGIGRHGMPTAMVDDGEFVEPEPMTRKYLGVLEAIRVDHPSIQHLAGYANGGTVGRETSAAAMAPSGPGIDYERLASAMGVGGPAIGQLAVHGVIPAELERGIKRSVFRELKSQGVPVGEPA